MICAWECGAISSSQGRWKWWIRQQHWWLNPFRRGLGGTRLCSRHNLERNDRGQRWRLHWKRTGFLFSIRQMITSQQETGLSIWAFYSSILEKKIEFATLFRTIYTDIERPQLTVDFIPKGPQTLSFKNSSSDFPVNVEITCPATTYIILQYL